MSKFSLNNLDKSTWESFKFQEITERISISVDPTTTELEVYVGLEHIDAEDIHIRRFGKPSDVTGNKLKCFRGDVIFGKRRAYQRKAAIVDFDGICSAHSFVFRAKTDVIEPELFPFFLHSDQFMHRAVDISVGGLSPTINWGDLKDQEFLLPPKEEQKKLAELLWAMDDVVEKEKSLLNKIDINFTLYIKHSFDLKKRLRIDQLGLIRTGRTPSTTKSEFWGGEIPFVTPSDNFENKYIDETVRSITSSFLPYESLIPKNSILYVCIASIGNLVINKSPVWINQQINAIIPKDSKNRTMIYYGLKLIKNQILRQAGHSVVPIINKNDFSKIRIPMLKIDSEIFEDGVMIFESTMLNSRQKIVSSNSLQKSLINQIF